MRRKLKNKQLGVAFVEFIVALSALLVVFLVIGSYLITASRKRAAASMDISTTDIPCLDPAKVGTVYPASAASALRWGTRECE